MLGTLLNPKNPMAMQREHLVEGHTSQKKIQNISQYSLLRKNSTLFKYLYMYFCEFFLYL